MKRKHIHRLGACAMAMHMLFSSALLGYASEYDPVNPGNEITENTDNNESENENEYQSENGYGSENGNGYANENGYENGNGYTNENGYENGNGYANENSYESGNDPESPYEAIESPENNSDEPQIVEEVYVLEADRSQISFGSLEQGSLAPRQDIVLTNNGLGDIWLIWHESDYHDCIMVDAPDNDYLSPGESCTYSIEADTSLSPGAYSAFILFGDADDPCFEHGVQVNISLNIQEPAPAPSAITSVGISPATTVADKNSSCTFTAEVMGENDYSREVVWSVSGQTSRNTFIDSNGTLTVGSDETASSLTVKAVSRQDSRYFATALVSLHNNSYFIQLQANPDSGGAVHGGGTVEEGGTIVISAAPHNGFVFDGWALNNNVVSSNSQYTVSNVQKNDTYVAIFKPVSCRINVNVNNSNAGTVTGSQNVDYGGRSDAGSHRQRWLPV